MQDFGADRVSGCADAWSLLTMKADMTVLADMGPTPYIILAITILLAIIVVAFKVFVVLRRGKMRLVETAAGLGLTYQRKADNQFGKAWKVLPEIKNGGSIGHLMVGQVSGVDVTAFQNTFVLMVSNAPIIIRHCVYATPAPGWPDLRVTRRGWFSRWRFKRGARTGLLTGDERFDARREVKCEDQTFARWLLGEDMRRLMLEADEVTWRIIGEQLCLVYKGGMRPEGLVMSVDRLVRFWSAVPTGEGAPQSADYPAARAQTM
jgi:hypothetical protein